MRVSTRLCYIAPPAIPERATVAEVHRYLQRPVPDLQVKLNDDICRVHFLIQTFQEKKTPGRWISHATDECRFASRRKIAPEDRPFPLHQFSYHNPDVLIDFQERNSVDPERDSGEDMTPIEPSDETAGRELALREQERTRRERIVNQEEFADVYFHENPTPLRLNITELSASAVIRLLTSVVPPPSTSTIEGPTSSTSDIATTSPSEPAVSIPLGEGPELWEHIWRSRTLENGAVDETLYVWRAGTRQKWKTTEELIAEGVKVRGPGEPEAKRKWTDGVVDEKYTKPPKAK